VEGKAGLVFWAGFKKEACSESRIHIT